MPRVVIFSMNQALMREQGVFLQKYNFLFVNRGQSYKQLSYFPKVNKLLTPPPPKKKLSLQISTEIDTKVYLSTDPCTDRCTAQLARQSQLQSRGW